MRNRPFVHVLALGLTLAGLAAPSQSRADSTPVAAGYDLFQTDPSGTSFDFGATYGTQSLMGVPLGTVPSSLLGLSSPPAPANTYVGMTDTIVERNQAVTTNGGTTTLTMVALQLESVNAVDASGDHLFVTLTPGVASTGLMTIFNNDTFNSTLDVNFNVLLGTSLATATIIATDESVTLSATGVPWTHTAPPGALLITGVDYSLAGTNPDGSPNTSQDFWPGTYPDGTIVGVSETSSLGDESHLVDPTTPEPSTWIMVVAAGLMVPAYARWSRRRA